MESKGEMESKGDQKIKSYAELQTYLSNWCVTNSVNANNAPHGVFWQDLSYTEFTTGSVPNYKSVKILKIGDGLGSNIVQALMGVGPLFGPDGRYRQMPGGGPYMQPAGSEPGPVVQPIIDWIDASCPQFRQ